MRLFRTFAPLGATLLALSYQTACSSDEGDEATGGKPNGGSGGASGSTSTGGKAMGGSAGKGGTGTTGGSAGTSAGGASGASGAGGAPGGAGGAGGAGEECNGMLCPEGTHCSECFNPDNPEEPLHACISEGMSC